MKETLVYELYKANEVPIKYHPENRTYAPEELQYLNEAKRKEVLNYAKHKTMVITEWQAEKIAEARTIKTDLDHVIEITHKDNYHVICALLNGSVSYFVLYSTTLYYLNDDAVNILLTTVDVGKTAFDPVINLYIKNVQNWKNKSRSEIAYEAACAVTKLMDMCKNN